MAEAKAKKTAKVEAGGGKELHRYRSHTCGALRSSDIGNGVRLSGWVHRVRDHGGLLFIDLKREVPEALKPRRIEIAAGSGPSSVTNVTTLDQSKVA